MKKLRICALSIFLISNSIYSSNLNIFSALFNGSCVCLCKWIEKNSNNNNDQTTREFQINPRNVLILAFAGIALYKLSNDITEFMRPYMLNALPNIGEFEKWKKEHALKEREKANDYETRMHAVKNREKLNLAQQQEIIAINDDVGTQEDHA